MESVSNYIFCFYLYIFLFFCSGAYGQSKLANILFSNELSRRLQERHSNVTANSLHPGFISTNLAHHVISAARQASPVDVFVKLLERFVMSGAMSADDGALTQVPITVSSSELINEHTDYLTILSTMC